jgi:hypothetical protein
MIVTEHHRHVVNNSASTRHFALQAPAHALYMPFTIVFLVSFSQLHRATWLSTSCQLLQDSSRALQCINISTTSTAATLVLQTDTLQDQQTQP